MDFLMVSVCHPFASGDCVSRLIAFFVNLFEFANHSVVVFGLALGLKPQDVALCSRLVTLAPNPLNLIKPFVGKIIQTFDLFFETLAFFE
jgi:hypothetical protein